MTETQKCTVHFRGTLRLDAPFANSPAECKGPNKEQMLQRLPINIGGAFVDTAIVPAATIRGRVRRAGARVIRAILDKDTIIGQRAFIGATDRRGRAEVSIIDASPELDTGGIAVLGKASRVFKEISVPAGIAVEPGAVLR